MNQAAGRFMEFTGSRTRSLGGGGVCRKLDRARMDFTTVHFDCLDHYHPRVSTRSSVRVQARTGQDPDGAAATRRCRHGR